MLVRLELVGKTYILVREEAIDGLGPDDAFQTARRLYLRGGQEIKILNSKENLKTIEKALDRDQQI